MLKDFVDSSPCWPFGKEETVDPYWGDTGRCTEFGLDLGLIRLKVPSTKQSAPRSQCNIIAMATINKNERLLMRIARSQAFGLAMVLLLRKGPLLSLEG